MSAAQHQLDRAAWSALVARGEIRPALAQLEQLLASGTLSRAERRRAARARRQLRAAEGRLLAAAQELSPLRLAALAQGAAA